MAWVKQESLLPLANALTNSDEQVRLTVVRELGNLQQRGNTFLNTAMPGKEGGSILSILESGTNDPSPAVREELLKMLKHRRGT